MMNFLGLIETKNTKQIYTMNVLETDCCVVHL